MPVILPLRAAAALAAALVVAGLARPAAAQTPVLAAESFSESFVGGGSLLSGPQVQTEEMGAVGRVIVGVSLGAPAEDQKLDLSAIRVALPEAAARRLCVAISTSDGRYSATSTHLVEAAYPEAPRLALTSGYRDALAAYGRGELLVSARQADACAADAGGFLAPAVADPAATRLIVSINLGHGRPKAWLEKDGAPATKKARCEKNEQAAKSHDCAIDVAGLSGGRYELVVDAGRLDGPSLIERKPLVLP